MTQEASGQMDKRKKKKAATNNQLSKRGKRKRKRGDYTQAHREVRKRKSDKPKFREILLAKPGNPRNR